MIERFSQHEIDSRLSVIRTHRTGWVATVLAFVLVLLLTSFPTASLANRMQAEPEVIEAGSGPLGERSFSLVGRGISSPDGVQFFGYLSTIAGLGPSDLFAGSPASVETARFTYAGEIADIVSESRADITSTVGAGALRVYFNENAGADWNDPASFANGQVVAELTLDLRDVLQRQAPGVGVSVGDGSTAQILAAEFTLNGEPVIFGREGMERRLRYVGALAPGSETGAPFTVALTGSATMTARESRPVPLGGAQATSASTPVPEVEACVGLQPWLDETLGALDRAATLGESVSADAELAELESAPLLAASEELAALAATQRELTAPANAEPANRLVVTALSTAARGLQGAVSAVDGNDADLLAQGQAALSDGRSLIDRAEEAVSAFSAGCS